MIDRSRTYGFSLILLVAVFTTGSVWGQALSTIGGKPGSAFRVGATARGMAMGNSMGAVTIGQLAGSENPAVVPFQQSLNGSIAYSSLSLDRRLNLLTFGQPLKPNAGIMFQILNAGVGNIDKRDRDGIKTGTTSTSENSFLLSFGLRPDTNVAIGIGTKILYHSLYDEVSSTSVGFNIGFLYRASSNLTLSAAILDLNSRYRWDSKALWGKSGTSIIEKFPTRRLLAAAYHIPEAGLLVTGQYESITPASFLKFGAEWTAHEMLTLRAGIDNVSLKGVVSARPAFGFMLRQSQDGWTPALEYTFVVEPYAPSSMHVIGITVSIP